MICYGPFRAGLYWLLALATPLLAVEPTPSVNVVFPAAGTLVSTATQTYLIGSVTPAATSLAVNGQTVSPWRTGGNPFHYSTTIVFPEPTDNVPVIFYADGLADASAAPVSARAEWPTYAVTAPLFAARARTLPGGGDTAAFLPPGLHVQGAGFIGRHTRFWLGGEHRFTETIHLAAAPEAPLPPRDLAPPDLADGFVTGPPSGRSPAEILIVLDPGHGGTSSGALGPTGVAEKEANLRQARQMRTVLEHAGFRVLMTRDSDKDVDLYERVRIAYRAKADALISIHHNATAPQIDPRLARHISTYAWNAIGLKLAHAIHPKLAAATPIADRGVMTASFAVCRTPAVPSCLLELDFIGPLGS